MSMHSAPKSGRKKAMGKGDFLKMHQPQMQTVLSVNTQCQCEGCASKIRSILKKTKGVESCKIDLEQGKVTVIGEVDQVKLMEKLSKKTDKHVELWGFPKGMNMNQFKNMHVSVAETGKGGKGNTKPQKKGGDDREMMNFHQMFNGKGGMGGDFKIPPQLKDMKMPSKDPKSVKFQMPDHDDDESEDEYDSDESFDESDDDHHFGHGHDHSHGVQKKSSGEGKKGFSLSNVPILNRWGSRKEEKSKKEGKPEGGNKKGGGKNGGDEFQNQNQSSGKNHGKKSGDMLDMVKNGGKNGQGKGKGGNNGGGNNNSNNWPVKGQQKGGGGGGKAMNNMQHKLEDINVGQPGANVARNMGQMYQPGQMGHMGNYQMGQMGNYPTRHPDQMGSRNMGQMGNYPMGHMGQMGSYPMGGQMGNFQSTEAGMLGMAPQNYNPYSNQQQQYMAMMMNQRQQQQHQQQVYGNGMFNNNAMMYGRPMNYGPPPTPPHAMDNHFTQYFNDENPNSCSVM